MYRKKAAAISTPWRSWTVPARPHGKHKTIVSGILAAIWTSGRVAPRSQVRIEELDDSKEKHRSALNRQPAKQKRNVATGLGRAVYLRLEMWPK